MQRTELIESLLAGCAEGEQCGPNLAYDSAYLALHQQANGKPEQQYGATIIPAEAPDWAGVEGLATDLFKRTKDLRVAAQLGRSWMELRGLAGYSDGLRVVEGLLERYWDEVHPALADGGEYDPRPRIYALAEVSGAQGCARVARQQALLTGDF